VELREEKHWSTENGTIFTGGPVSHAESTFAIDYRLSKLLGWIKVREVTRVLDIGCGEGGYIRSLQGLGVSAIGIEYDDIAARLAPKDSVVIGLGEKLPLRNSSIQLVMLIEVLEHVQNIGEVLSEVKRVCTNNGFVFVSVPNRFFLLKQHGFRIRRIQFGNIFKIGIPFLAILPNNIRKHFQRARIFTQKDICSLLSQHGFRVVKVDFIPPPLDRIRNKHLAKVLRDLVFKVQRRSPFKLMGESCVLLAYKPKAPI
jgi:SAM-dependent methyltransferase